jgi:hypothetical protein
MSCYKKLFLDARCLKPAYEVNDEHVYIDALSAINSAMSHPHITQSEKNILECTRKEVRKNRFTDKPK